MKKHFFVFFILLFSIYYISFSSYKIEYKSNGFILNIENIEYSQNSNQIKIINLDNNNFNLEADTNFQMLSFLFAYPETYSYKIISEEYDSPKEFSYFPKLENQSIDIIKVGKLRNIDIGQIHIFPYKFSAIAGTVQLLKSIKIEFNYNNLSSKEQNKFNKRELSFFENVINFEHINKIITSKTTEKLLNNNIWYNNNLDYLKIQTKDDGVTRIKMSEVLKIYPQWQNKSSKFLQILDNGKRVPIYIKNDDGTIDSDDLIYFFGERPKGDSTYLDHYAITKAYYLTYDESATSPIIELAQNNSSNYKNINSVNTEFHIEEDSTYFWGVYFRGWQLITETTRGEGWYWKYIYPRIKVGDYYLTDDKFTNDLPITPSENPEDEMKFSMNFFAFEDTAGWKGSPPYPPAYYDLNFYLNGNFTARDSFVGWRNSTMTGSLKSKELFSGNNFIEVITKEYDPNTNAQAGIDYFTVEGKVTPFAYKSKFYLEDNFGEAVNFSSSGYSSNDIAIIDTSNNRIAFFEGKSGSTLRLGARQSGKSFITLGINDSIVSTSKMGLHIFVMNNPSQNKYEYKFFENNFSNALAFLNTISNDAVIEIAYNSTISLTQDVKDFISNLGGIEIKNLNPSNAYIFGTQIGSGKFIEKLSQNSIATGSIFIEHNSGISYQTNIKMDAGNYKAFINSSDFSDNIEISAVNKTDLRNTEIQSEAIYISHKNFIEESRRLAQYREKTLGIKVNVIDVDDIYKEFSYGKKHPESIKDFINFAYRNWENRKLTDVLLVGDATWDTRSVIRNNLTYDYLPTYGYPASDWWYTLLDGDSDLLGDINIGRISANTSSDMKNVVDKLIDYDTTDARPWMKEYLMIIGGYDEIEINRFYNDSYDYFNNLITEFPFGGNISYVKKTAEGGTSNLQANDIIKHINQGKLMTIYVGHASAEIFDMDGWEEQNLSNKSRYTILSTISCNTGAFAEPYFRYSRNERYLLAKDKGTIASLGSTAVGYVGPHLDLIYKFTKILVDTTEIERSIGQIFSNAKLQIPQTTFGYRLTNWHYNFLGDPLTRFRVEEKPEFYYLKSNIQVQNQNGSTNFNENDSKAIINGTIFNNGIASNERFDLLLIRDYEGKIDTTKFYVPGLYFSLPFYLELNISQMPGVHKCSIVIDPLNKVDEANELNNVYTFNFTVYKDGLLVLDPKANTNIDLNNKIFRFLNPLADEQKFEYEFSIYEDNSTDSKLLINNSTEKQDKSIIIKENYIDWHPEIALEEGNIYYLGHKLKNLTINKESDIQLLPFYAENKDIAQNLTIGKFDSKSQIENFDMKNFSLDTNSNLKISNNAKNVFISGFCCGDETKFPHAKIIVGDSIITSNNFNKGFNFGMVSANNNDNKYRYTYFASYYVWDYWRINPDGIDMINYLRDSVRDDEYLLATNNEYGFGAYIINTFADTTHHKNGTIDSIIATFEMFGGILPRTIKPIIEQYRISDDPVANFEAFRSDYIFTYNLIGWKGAKPGTVYEKLTYNRDTLILEAQIFRYSDSSKMITNRLGPAKYWKKFNILGNINHPEEKSTMILYGVDESGNISEIYKGKITQELDISNLQNIRYIFAELSLNIDNFNVADIADYDKFEIRGITAEYESMPELAIIKSETKLAVNNELRGYDSKINAKIENISPRAKADSSDFLINIKRGGSEEDKRISNTGILPPNSNMEFSEIIKTDNLDSENVISLVADYNDKAIEEYTFNNFDEKILKVAKDTIKPTVELIIDGNLHKNGDYIQIKPEIEIRMYDNSPLLITDEYSITVRLNGYMHPYQRTLKWSFDPVNDGTNLRAKFKLNPDSIQYEDVLIIIYAKDAEGNRDTVEYTAKVTLKGAKFENIYNYPNPFAETTAFSLNYFAPMNSGKAIFEIFDISGYKHRILSKELVIGKNTIEWDGRDHNGYTLPAGLYFVRVSYDGYTYIEPKVHKLLKFE